MEFIQITDVEPAPKGGRHFKGAGITPSLNELTEKSIKDESSNPVFNFSEHFFEDLQKITPIDLAMSVPFVALRSMKDQKVDIDFNLALFQKPIDFSKISSGERYSDRPIASLIELKIKSDQGSGYIYFQEISFTIKVHKPDIAMNGILISLLFPGFPMEIEYGWRNSKAPKDSPLNKTEKLQFALKSYNISYNVDGQIDLTIDGTAFSERFNNTLLGDEGGTVADLKKSGLTPEQIEDIMNKDGLSAQIEATKNYVEYLQSVKDSPDQTGKRSMKIVNQMLESYQNIGNNARGRTKKNLDKKILALKDKSQAGAEYFEVIKGKKHKLFKEGFITIHDLVSTVCKDTFEAFQKITSTEKLRMLYGLFSDEVGKNQSKFAGQPIADFPIDLVKFRESVTEQQASNGGALTLEAFFNIIIRDFLHDDGYWKKLESTNDGVRIPYAYLALNNYRDGGDNGAAQMDISLIDIGRDVPMTSELIKGVDTLSVGDFEKKLRAEGLPILKLGHGNSFIRELKMENVTDQYIKAALIKRMADSSSTLTRAFVPPGLQSAIEGSDVKTPLHLPLRGSMNVLGSVDFKPFRAFGLLSGIFVTDAVYKIMSVTHTLNNSGFTTNLEIMYN